ncbi:MAG: hypothetical protein ACO1SV_17860 [Fimbriimonas sp.]
MLALFCAAAATAQVPVGQPPRLRTVLPNGAIILVERIPGAPSLAMGLYASSRLTPETPATHGHRHLLEHLVASGQHGDLDRRLETAGGFMRARTLRDAIAFEMILPPGGLTIGIDATRDILSAQIKSADVVTRELKILQEEDAIRDPVARASELAWRRVYGDAGLDPFGSIEAMRGATPESLEKLRKAPFSASNLVLAIGGDVDLDAATKAATDALAFLPTVKANPAPRRAANPTDATGAIEGAYRVLPVRGYRDPATAAALAAALAVASEVSRSTVVYTPSGAPGLILVGTSDAEVKLEKALTEAQPAALFARGRDLARRWVRNRLQEPEGIVSFRALLLTEASDLRPETMLENLDTMSYAAFASALESLRATSALRIGGTL